LALDAGPLRPRPPREAALACGPRTRTADHVTAKRSAIIDRGLSYKCEEHGEYELRLNGEQIDYSRFHDEDDAEEVWVENEGCGLYFCSDHEGESAAHDKIASGKPDSIEWLRHMLTDDSWSDWRNENPGEAAAAQKRVEDAAPAT